ncbi:MAG: putative sensor/response regulator hybrid [Cyanobacteria bacterium RYN_339]|nr:putative sensor/response regulator hybrid [Cyanobacteria bacterium RYN_339]
MARVLIVEDQPELARIAYLVVTRDGHDAQIAFDGYSALAALEGGGFELVLVDNVMPGGMDGEDLVRAIRADAALAHLPLIAVTAKAMLEEQEAMREAGVCAIVVKPYRAQELRDAITRELARKERTPLASAPV